MMRKPSCSLVPLGDKHNQSFCCSLFFVTAMLETHAPCCCKCTASNVRPDLLCFLEREQRKSVFEPINDNKQQLFENSPDRGINKEGAASAVNYYPYYSY